MVRTLMVTLLVLGAASVDAKPKKEAPPPQPAPAPAEPAPAEPEATPAELEAQAQEAAAQTEGVAAEAPAGEAASSAGGAFGVGFSGGRYALVSAKLRMSDQVHLTAGAGTLTAFLNNVVVDLGGEYRFLMPGMRIADAPVKVPFYMGAGMLVTALFPPRVCTATGRPRAGQASGRSGIADFVESFAPVSGLECGFDPTRWQVGLRATAGAAVEVEDVPAELFMELSPTFFLFLDERGFVMAFQTGVRYFF